MRLRLQPKDTAFFTMFTAASENVTHCVEVLAEFVGAPAEERAAIRARMREVEHAGDDATHNIMNHLNRAFITPFDREDIYRLAVRLDDVIDHIDAAVDLATLYQVGTLPDGVRDQVELLGQLAALAADAMPKLAKPGNLNEYWVRTNELENEADQVYRKLLSWLFSGELEPLDVMKLKEVVEELEQAADAFEHVADVVHTIAVKES